MEESDPADVVVGVDEWEWKFGSGPPLPLLSEVCIAMVVVVATAAVAEEWYGSETGLFDVVCAAWVRASVAALEAEMFRPFIAVRRSVIYF